MGPPFTFWSKRDIMVLQLIEENIMRVSPIADRIDIFLVAYPNAKYIPIHPDDLAGIGKMKIKPPLPIKVLGLINPSK